jgi:hypothetical protein
LNGQPVKGNAALKDGDRLRVGTQELVFCRVEQAAVSSVAKTTGFLRHCAKCRLPYPQEVGACPNCGSAEQLDEETLSGQFGGGSQGAWTVQLLVEVLEKALSLGRVSDATRILRRATTQVEERLASNDPVDVKHMNTLAMAAAKVSLESGESTWGVWSANVFRRMHEIPSAAHIDRLAELATRYPVDMSEAIESLARHCVGIQRTWTAEQTDALARLEQLRTSLLEAARRGRATPTKAVPS